MFQIDGVALRQNPISLLALDCGGFDFAHPGHDVSTGDTVACPDGCGDVVVTGEPVRTFSVG